MSTLVKASELAQRVVVTYAGEDVAQIKDSRRDYVGLPCSIR